MTAKPPRNWEDAERRLAELEDTIHDLSQVIRENEKKLVELPYIKSAIDRVDENCKAVRQWVERQVERQQNTTIKREQMSTQTKVAVITGVFLLVATMIGAIVTILTTVGGSP